MATFQIKQVICGFYLTRYNIIATKEEVLKHVENHNKVIFVYLRLFKGKESIYKPYEKLSEDMKKLNIDLNKKIILYCTIGNRSSFVFIPLYYLGARNLKIYTRSWYKWGNDESLPIEKEKYKN